MVVAWLLSHLGALATLNHGSFGVFYRHRVDRMCLKQVNFVTFVVLLGVLSVPPLHGEGYSAFFTGIN